MNSLTRTSIVAGCFALCAAGVIIGAFPADRMAGDETQLAESDPIDILDSYHRVAAANRQSVDLSRLESVIRQDQPALSHPGHIEFGSVNFYRNKVAVQVLFFTGRGGMTAYLYTLKRRNDSWKVDGVQRLWFVPRSRLVRGIKV